MVTKSAQKYVLALFFSSIFAFWHILSDRFDLVISLQWKTKPAVWRLQLAGGLHVWARQLGARTGHFPLLQTPFSRQQIQGKSSANLGTLNRQARNAKYMFCKKNFGSAVRRYLSLGGHEFESRA